MDGAYRRDLQRLEPVEHGVDLGDRLLDLRLGVELVELADVGADDEPLRLARHDDQAGQISSVRLDVLDDASEFLERALSKRIGALPLAVEDRPGNLLDIDVEPPIMKIRQVPCLRRFLHQTSP